MNIRYRITKNPNGDEGNLAISLDECMIFFDRQVDFSYAEQYQMRSKGTVMTIRGHFFMWESEGKQFPFRYYEGDVYVAIYHEKVYARMVEVATGLSAHYLEG
jgi:hypothetical protein